MIDIDTIKMCCQLCINSYKGEHGKVEEIFNLKSDFEKEDVQGHYGIKDGKLYIVFQGSHGKDDWFDNFKFWKNRIRKVKPYGNLSSKIEVHAGFLSQYKQIRDIIHVIVKCNYDRQEIIITGHSLGGALATLCAVDLNYNFENKFVHCITFGSPRVGNKAFVESFNRRILSSSRIVNGDDIVAKVPMSIFGYRHIDKLINIGKKKFCKIFSTEDHEPEEYLSNLK